MEENKIYDRPADMVEGGAVRPDRSAPAPGRRRVRRIVLILLLLLAGYLGYQVLRIFVSPDHRISQIYLIPSDAVLVIQADEPVKDWESFSRSAPWQKLRQAPVFAEIAARADYVDSLLQGNKALLSLVGRRDIMISLHKTRSDDWDYLIVLDLQRTSKLNVLKNNVEQIYKAAGRQVTERKYKGIAITELRDPDTREMLYTAFVDNHFVASYSPRLVEASIDERENPTIGREYAFIEVEKLVHSKGLCRIYVNYARLPEFSTIYLGQRNEYVDMFCRSMSFAGMSFVHSDNGFDVRGYSLAAESPDPYVAALSGSGTHRMRAHEIMSARTAFYANFGFADVKTFVGRLERAMEQKNRTAYDSYKKTKDKLEKYFGISMEEDFLGWMSGEFAVSQSEPGLLGREPEYILAVRATSMKEARKHMDIIEKRIKRRTPVSIKAVDYRGYEVNYVEMKGFFKLFFGGLLDRFETPYYTFMGYYVVFSTSSSALLSFIEDREQGNLMREDEGFKSALSRAEKNSTMFAYVDMRKFYYQLPSMLNGETWQEVSANRDVLLSFPQLMLQLSDAGGKSSVRFVADYDTYVPEPATASAADDDPAMDEGASSQKELMSELKRFHVEKFEGNVLREFYPGGALKSEAEIRDGRRNGRYREYYEDGTLRLRGKYAGDKPRGTWKYYTSEGAFDHKERY